MRLNPHLEAQFAPGGVQANLLVNKTRKMLNPIQNRLNFQLHRWSSGLSVAFVFDTECITEDQPFFHPTRTSGFQTPVVGSACGPGDRALQECILSTEPPVDCESSPPRFGSNSGPELLFLDAIATTAKAKNSSSGYRPQAAIFTCFTHKFCYRPNT